MLSSISVGQLCARRAVQIGESALSSAPVVSGGGTPRRMRRFVLTSHSRRSEGRRKQLLVVSLTHTKLEAFMRYTGTILSFERLRVTVEVSVCRALLLHPSPPRSLLPNRASYPP